MRRLLIRGVGFVAGLLSLSACEALPEAGQYSLTLSNPTAGQSNLPLTLDVTASISGGFTLHASGCDPAAFTVDGDNGVLVPAWSPYDCMDANGEVVEGQGNIQYFVDGFFIGYFTSESFEVDLSPKLSFAYYEPMEIDEDNDPDTAPTEQNVFICNFYYPADNLGYAQALYESFMAYTAEDLYGAPLYEVNGDGVATEKPGTVVYDGFGAVPAAWLYFSYGGIYDQTTEAVADQHIFYAELHYDNHEPVYGVNKDRIITGGFDVSQLPADWCGSGILF